MTPQRDTIAAAAAALRVGGTTPTALLDGCLDRMAAWEPHLRSVTTITAESARDAARQAERELAGGGDRGPLHGIPVLVKDLIDVEGVPTTGGSGFLRDNVAATDAPVVRRLRKAGAVLVGKSNTHEFAFGALTPPTRNPWDLGRMPGGSSGGSAAAVGAGLVPAALGTDTAGSVREPAALCGLVGLKPTFGRVSCRGVLPLAWSLDTVGPLTATVEDCRILFSVLDGPDAAYRSTASRTAAIAPPRPGPAGLRVGVVRELLAPLQRAVEEPLRALLDRLAAAGADVREVSIGDVDELIAVTFVILGAEALSYHRAWLGRHPERYAPDVLAYLRLAERYSAADYVDAQRLRTAFRDRVDALLADADVLLSPAQMVLAPELTDETVRFPGGGEAPRDLTLIRPLAPFSLSGHPALALPVARTGPGLPVGVQLVGAAFRDEELLDAAAAVAGLTPWDLALPASP